MNELELKHNEKVIAAWHSICDWCKENLANKVPGGIVVSFPFQTFGWKRLAVTEDGDVQLHSGSHGDSSTRVYIKEFMLEFVFSACMGCNHHTHFFDSTKKPYHDNNKLFEQSKSAQKLIASSRHIYLGTIEDAINEWKGLKADLLRIVEHEKSLDTFKP